MSKINVCDYSLLQRYEGRRTIVYISHLQISVFPICLIAMKMDLLLGRRHYSEPYAFVTATLRNL